MNARESLVFAAGERLRPGFARDAAAGWESAPARCGEERFAAICRHAFSRSAHYRRKYETAGLGAEISGRAEDAARVPPLTKEELGAGLLAGADPSWTVSLESGGTTGRRASTFLGLDYVLFRYARLLGALRALGWSMGRPISALHPVEYGYWRGLPGLLRRGRVSQAAFDFAQQYVVYGLFHNRRNIFYSSAAFERGPADALARALARRPAVLIGRPDVLSCLAKRAAPAPGEGGAGAVLSVGNVAAAAALRGLAAALGRPAVNMYASTEAGYVGLGCGRSGEWVHVDEANYRVEVDAAQDGEVLVTDFNNYGMPLIRYRTGDVGELAARACACGRGGLQLRVRGRRGFHVLSRRGEKLYDADFLGFFAGVPDVWAGQVAADSAGRLTVLLRTDASAHRAEEVVDELCAALDLDRGAACADVSSPLVVGASGKLQCVRTRATQ